MDIVFFFFLVVVVGVVVVVVVVVEITVFNVVVFVIEPESRNEDIRSFSAGETESSFDNVFVANV